MSKILKKNTKLNREDVKLTNRFITSSNSLLYKIDLLLTILKN